MGDKLASLPYLKGVRAIASEYDIYFTGSYSSLRYIVNWISRIFNRVYKIKSGRNLSFNAILDLVEQSEQVFASEPQLIEVNGDFISSLDGVVFVGDTHGHFSSTFAVFSEFDPSRYLIVLLGDYIDRGPDSVRNINYILAQKRLHMQNVVVLRGNHETPLINFSHGFYDELSRIYPKRAFELFEVYNRLFSFIPYSTVLEDSILAFHGGLAINLQTHQDINKIRKEDVIPEDPTAFQMLWNDPNEDVLGNSFFPSERGGGCFYFGREVVTDFLSKNGLSYIIRAHGPHKEGYYFHFKKQFERETTIKKQQNLLSVPRPVSGFEGRLLSIYSSIGQNINDPKIALLTNEKLRIISLKTICKSRGIKINKSTLWAEPTVWGGRECLM